MSAADPGIAGGPLVLALETSCDESAAALMRGRELIAADVFSQIAIHGEYGGVVPEVASVVETEEVPVVLVIEVSLNFKRNFYDELF